jgi:hypothetical protein
MWIMADVNIKDALNSLQMELEGEHIQIRWKAAQKKNTKNQIVIYSLPPGFDPKGIICELLYGLKESKKELCDGKRFTLDQNMACRDMPLPLLNGYYKQTPPPKAPTLSKGLENFLNKNKEFTQNGCRCFILNMTLLTILGWMQFGTNSRRMVGANLYWICPASSWTAGSHNYNPGQEVYEVPYLIRGHLPHPQPCDHFSACPTQRHFHHASSSLRVTNICISAPRKASRSTML